MMILKVFSICILCLNGALKADNPSSSVEVYFNNFDALAKAEKWEEILIQGAAALEAARNSERSQDEAKICAQLTSTAFYQGDYSKALDYAGRCHELAETFDDPALLIRSLYLESAVYRAFAGKNEKDAELLFAKAVDCAKKASQIYSERQVEDLRLKGKVYFNLGAAHADNPNGDLKEASFYYSEASDAFKRVGASDDAIRTSIRLGKVYLLQNNYAATEKIIEEIRPKIAHERLAMHTDYLEAQFKRAMQETMSALENAKRGLKRAEKLGAKEDFLRLSSLIDLIEKEMASTGG